ncbi:hypothetical protein MTO96_031355 [Rhipicephalus appendiculatus]
METRKKALKAQEASKDTSKAEWVMCSVCDSWAKLQDTGFSSIEEADAAPDYKCRKCTKLNSFREEMMALVKQAAESNKLAIADLRMRLVEETATRRREGEHLEALLRVEKTRNAELAAKVALLEQPNPSLIPISMMDSKGTEMTAKKNPPEHRLRAGKCDGRRGQRWCLAGLLPQLTDIYVDENGEESIGSDNHSIKLRFGAQAYPTRLPGAQTGCRTLTDAEIEEVAGWMEEEAVQKDMETFDDFHTWIKNMIGKVGSKHRPSRQKRKAWWDNDVATALATRKQLCRQHRFALRLGADEAEVQDLWARYLRAKKSMSALVQDRMRTINRKILKEIKEAGRDAGEEILAAHTGSEVDSPAMDRQPSGSRNGAGVQR